MRPLSRGVYFEIPAGTHPNIIKIEQESIVRGRGLATGYDGRLKRVLREAAGLGPGTRTLTLWGHRASFRCCGSSRRAPQRRQRFLEASRACNPGWTGAAWRQPGTEPGAAVSSVFRAWRSRVRPDGAGMERVLLGVHAFAPHHHHPGQLYLLPLVRGLRLGPGPSALCGQPSGPGLAPPSEQLERGWRRAS
ncbi:hypothetical protein NDU88_003196 [Pleurodeles waltl]|uniref:Uncharacterized protein n=1 Tax=Pleurodeles waltl TaxID=8319 RepID=A0AAV7W4X5_PLEWA|nr:hypothetical protein NDU88_003196 [Pleurodeles waltl]